METNTTATAGTHGKEVKGFRYSFLSWAKVMMIRPEGAKQSQIIGTAFALEPGDNLSPKAYQVNGLPNKDAVKLITFSFVAGLAANIGYADHQHYWNRDEHFKWILEELPKQLEKMRGKGVVTLDEDSKEFKEIPEAPVINLDPNKNPDQARLLLREYMQLINSTPVDHNPEIFKAWYEKLKAYSESTNLLQ